METNNNINEDKVFPKTPNPNSPQPNPNPKREGDDRRILWD